MYVCATDAALLRATALPDVLASRIVDPGEFLTLYREGKVGGAVVDREAIAVLRADLSPGRRTSVVPLIELSPVSIHPESARPSFADAIVARDRAHIELLPKIRRAGAHRALTAAASALRAKFAPRRAVESALCAVPTCTPPFVSVEAVARFANCVASTLDGRWARWLAMGPGHRDQKPPSLHTFVTWPLFLSALGEKRNEDEGWEHPAARLHTTRGRLARFADEHCGQPLGVLELDQPMYAIQTFEREILAPLGIALAWGATV